jgi:sulfite exporter TauE/SafE
MILVGGLLGSSHCVGMCGGFAAMVGLQTSTVMGNLRAQLAFSCGRLMSYTCLGAIAGFAGQSLIKMMPKLIDIPAVLCVVAGLFLSWEGLKATGIFRGSKTGASTSACLFAPLFSSLLKGRGLSRTFVAGIAIGLLPCGLVYAFVSLATSTGDMLAGGLTMLCFGIGTVPLMVITGCGSMFLNWTARQRIWQIAAWSVVATGLLTVSRGAAFFQTASESTSPSCPFCAQSVL